MNPIRKLRDALGWSQTRLAQEVGRSYQTIRNWEAGHRVPPEAIEKLKSIAAEHRLGDIALELSSAEWQISRVFQPGETIISGARPVLSREALGEREHPGRKTAHRLVDEIYDSRDAGAISALYGNLSALSRLVQLIQQPGRLAPKRKK